MTLGIDSSALLSYYQLKAGINTGASSTGALGAASTAPKAPTPPWFSTPTAAQTSALVTAALDGASVINPNAVKINVAGASSNYKSLFTLYQGLVTLKDLAAQAAKTGQSAGQQAALQKAFTNGLAQIQAYLGTSPFNGFKVIAGSDSASQTSSASILKETDTYTTGTIFAGDQNAPVPAFAGPIAFSATVTKQTGEQVTVNFNLDDLGSTPRTVGNVVNYLNSQLSAAGVDTTFSAVQTPAAPQVISVGGGKTVTLPAGPNTFSLKLNGNTFESLAFSAPTQTPAIYIAQTAGVNPPPSTTSATSTTAGASTTSSSVAGATQQLLKIDPNASTPRTFTDALGNQVTNVSATATGADGSVYVLGDINGPTTAGETDASQKIAGSQDVALLKYDSAGNLLSTSVLGAASAASGLALTVSADGSKVAVAGTVTGALNGTAAPTDPTIPTSFVRVYDSEGNPVFTARQNAASGDQVNSVAFGADGSVYVAGSTQSSLTSTPISGLSAGYVTGYSATGVQTFTTQVGGAGQNSVNGIAVDGSSIITAGVENGDAVVHSFTIPTSGAPTLTATRDLGAVQGGSVAGVSINTDGSIVIAGTTHNGALDAGTVTTAYSSGQEAFVAKLANADLSASASDALTYYKGSGDTSASALTIAGGQVYIAGQISVPPATGQITAFDGYVAQIDPSTGAVSYSTTISGPNHESAPHGIAVDPNGSSVLDILGLPTGTINYTPNPNVVANTSVSPGDQFTLGAYGVTRTVTITATDTLKTLAEKILQASAFQATAKVTTVAGVQQLQITPVNAGAQVTLGAGPSGQNALTGLGLTAGIIGNATIIKSKTSSLQTSYGLNLPANLNLSSAANIAAAEAALTSATGTVARIYTGLSTPPTPKTNGATNKSANAPVPKYLTAEIASYKSALARLGGSSSTGGSSLASLF